VLCSGAVALAPSAPARAASAPAVSVLDNGMTVATDQLAGADTVTIAVSVRAGSRDEPAAFRGGAHWLEHLHFLGSKRYPTPAALFDAVAAAGGIIDADTGVETTDFYASIPVAGFTTAIDVLSDMLVNPLFPRDLAERERGVVLDEIQPQVAAPSTSTTTSPSAFTLLRETLLGPVAQSASGTVKSVSALTYDDAMAFHALHYTAGNMAVAVVGPLPADYVVRAAAYYFAGLPPGGALTTPLPAAKDSLRISAGGRSQTVYVGQRVPGLTSPDALVLFVIDGLLDDPGTRIADAIDGGDTTSDGSTILSQYSDVGFWVAEALGDPNEVLAIVQQQIRLLQTQPVSDTELQKTINIVVGRLSIGGERLVRQAELLSRSALFGAALTLRQEIDTIRSITPVDVKRVAKTDFDADKLSVAAAKLQTPGAQP
jgi:predicted Zn-dependent peptidase